MGRAILILLTIAVVMVIVHATVQPGQQPRQPIQFYPGPGTTGPPVF